MTLLTTITGIYSSAMLQAVAVRAVAYWLGLGLTTGVWVLLFNVRKHQRIWK